MSEWPATLPQTFDQTSYSEASPDMVVRTKMDTGPVKIRRRFTAAPYTLSGSMKLTSAQTNTLDTFYTTTINGGANSFTFTHPRKLTTVTCRFTAPPKYAALNQDFMATLQFEVMP